MKVIKSVKEMKEWSNGKEAIGFVPTMGALHPGHLSLVENSLKNSKFTVVSLFVNKVQFNNSDDFENYPSTLKEDLECLERAGVDAVFLPTHEMMYPDDYAYKITESINSQLLCGSSRPGHFDGVLTVVMKLFQIVQPEVAYFGEKDFQQLELIRGMVESFFLDLKIVGCPIVRDEKGLALSSRNVRLSEAGLKKAQSFANQLSSLEDLEKLQQSLEENSIEVDYLKNWKGRRLAAVQIEDVRLIDNVEI